MLNGRKLCVTIGRSLISALVLLFMAPPPRFARSLWRVKAGFHTLPQVSVGAAVGAVDAVCWYHFCQVYFSVQARTHSMLIAIAERLFYAGRLDIDVKKAFNRGHVAGLKEHQNISKPLGKDGNPALCNIAFTAL